MKNNVYSLLLSLIVSMSFFRCTLTSDKDYGMQIKIGDAKHFKLDFRTGEYTRYYVGGSQQTIQLKFSEEERRKIVDKYYSLTLNKLPPEFSAAHCKTHSSAALSIEFKTKAGMQKALIDLTCYRDSSDVHSIHLQKFVESLEQLVVNKEQFKTLKPSDFWEM